jgi:predicted HTH transcriptional regulator
MERAARNRPPSLRDTSLDTNPETKFLMIIQANQNKDQVIKFIEKGEDENLELKSSFSKAVIETVVAFSNKSGGTIILGVNDKKETVGITITEETVQKWINEIKQNTEPSV